MNRLKNFDPLHLIVIDVHGREAGVTCYIYITEREILLLRNEQALIQRRNFY